MKREFLAGLGLSDEVIEQVMAEHGKTVQATQSKLDEAESKLKEANSTLDTLKKSNKDNEELQNELKMYKDKVSQLEANAKETAKKPSKASRMTEMRGIAAMALVQAICRQSALKFVTALTRRIRALVNLKKTELNSQRSSCIRWDGALT